MFEVLITGLFVVVFFYINVFWLKILLLLIYLGLVLPGFYAMLRGAPFVPSTSFRIKIILKFAELDGDEVVYDLGCGDGRLIEKIADRGVKEAIGYEYSIPTCFYAKLRKIFLRGNYKIKFGNFWKKDFSSGDVLVCFLFEGAMERIKNEIWPKLKKGTKLISNNFRFEGIDHDLYENGVYLYVKK